MTYRKTWFDYVLWVVYAGICVMLLAYLGNSVYTLYVGAPLAKLGTFLPFPILICLYTGIRFLSQTIRKKYHVSAHAAAMTESLVVSVSFVFGLILRLKDGQIMSAAYGYAPVFEPGEYYELAVVRAGADSPALAHGLSDLFVRALRVVFSFLGNSMEAAMLFQIFLQMIALLFAYLAVRKAAGRFAACAVLIPLAFFNVFIRKIYLIDPECMLLAVWFAGLCLVLGFVKASLAGRKGLGGFVQAVFVGFVLGCLCYLDLSALFLLPFLAGLFTGKMGEEGSRKRLAGYLLLTMAGIAAGFFFAIGIDASVSGIGFYQGLMCWIGPYTGLGSGGRIFGVIRTEFFFFALLFLPASFLGFEFIRGGREQDFTLWLLPCILLSPVFLIDFSVVGLDGVVLFFWCVLAALGLKNAALGGQAEVLREKIEEINAAAAPIPVISEPVAAAPEKKPRFLENPLPLPKKHVKREMDYDYEVAEADMHYQVEITSGDDFEL